VPIQSIESRSHAVEIKRPAADRASVRLKPFDTIPNKDLVVRFRLGSKEPELALLTHRSPERGGYFVALIAPPDRPAASLITPKEMVFVVDCSGSMSGEPMAKVKQAMRHALKNLDPRDSFQVIRFSEGASQLGPRPRPATAGNIKEGLRFIEQLRGSGGTRMIEGIKAALDFPADPERLRIVCFMTDGYIGNETEILAAIEERLGNGGRLFAFGIGNSVNRYLLDRMAEVGRGVVDYVLLTENTDTAVGRFYDRVRSPVLTDIEFEVDGNLAVSEVYPERIPDLFAGHPLLLCGRYDAPGRATVTLKGRLGGERYSRRFAIELPAETPTSTEALASVWARARIADLMASQYRGEKPEVVAEITELALTHRLVTAYTSFVAVEERIETAGGVPRTVVVPVEMPEGVSYEGVFGEADGMALRAGSTSSMQMKKGGGPRFALSAPMERAPEPPPPPNAPPLHTGSHSRESAEEVLWSREDAAAASTAKPLACTLAASRTQLRIGERLTLELTITNTSSAAIELPEPLVVGRKGLRLQIIDARWNEVSVTGGGAVKRTGTAGSTRRSLAPGESLTVTILVGDPKGIQLPGPGVYHVSIAALGGEAVDSNLITLRIAP
jgi:Ca-activated chloride channel family protein